MFQFKIRDVLWLAVIMALVVARLSTLVLAEDKLPAAGDSPVKMSVTSRDIGKGHFCSVDLRLHNRNAFPVWFIFAYRANVLLRDDGKFSAEYKPDSFGNNRLPFDAEEYNERRGGAIVVSHYGKDSFRAILVPGGGQFHFSGFEAYAFSEPPRFLDVWEVKSLKVNDKTALEKWLPFPVESSASVKIRGHMGDGSQRILNIDRDAKPFPNERVVSVIAEPLHRYVIPLPE